MEKPRPREDQTVALVVEKEEERYCAPVRPLRVPAKLAEAFVKESAPVKVFTSPSKEVEATVMFDAPVKATPLMVAPGESAEAVAALPVMLIWSGEEVLIEAKVLGPVA